MKILRTLVWLVAVWVVADALLGAKAAVVYHSSVKGYDASALVMAKAVFAGSVVVLVCIADKLVGLWKPS